MKIPENLLEKESLKIVSLGNNPVIFLEKPLARWFGGVDNSLSPVESHNICIFLYGHNTFSFPLCYTFALQDREQWKVLVHSPGRHGGYSNRARGQSTVGLIGQNAAAYGGHTEAQRAQRGEFNSDFI